MIALQRTFLGVTGSATGVVAVELSVDLVVSLVMFNWTSFSCHVGVRVGVLVLTGINVDDGLILDFGTRSLSSGQKPALLKPAGMLLGFFTKASLQKCCRAFCKI